MSTTIVNQTQPQSNTENIAMLSAPIADDAALLMSELWQGGEWGNLWRDDDRESLWRTCNAIPSVSTALAWGGKANIYFCVHPRRAKMDADKRGGKEHIALLNCLYAEFDGKDFVTREEYEHLLPADFADLKKVDQGKAEKAAREQVFMANRQPYLDRAWAHVLHVKRTFLAPSWINHSGGGFHCYWLLDRPVQVTDSNLDHLDALQKRWVALIGGDDGAKDLPRVLRVPGTPNHKYADKPIVTVLEKELYRYPLGVFEELCPSVPPKATVPTTATVPDLRTAHKADTHDDVIGTFRAENPLGALLQRYGYTPCSPNRYARPGSESGRPSVTIAVIAGIERSFHHSSNDALHTESNHARDAFDVWCELEHDGNQKAAYEAAKKAQGKWEETKVAVAASNEETDPPKAKGKRKDDDEEKIPVADQLYELAMGELRELFTSPDGEAYALVPAADHHECYRVRSMGFRGWLTALYRTKRGRIPNGEALQSAINLIAWDARTTVQDVFVRVGGCNGKVYVDLGTPEWDAIEVDGDGWRIVASPPIAFRRPPAMHALPLPQPGGTLELLRPFLNLEAAQYPLVFAWIVAAFNPRGPYPVMAFTGEHGAAKSTNMRVIKQIIDPSAAGLRGQPDEIRDLMIAAHNGWALGFDNVSFLSSDLSDALCRIATGGGFAKRTLHTDLDETMIDVQRPVLLNGIGDVVARPDLMDRALLIVPPVIDDSARRDETEFWQAFNEKRPLILGAVLDAVSMALRNLPNVMMDSMPRMADFARIGVAADAAWGGGFLEHYHQNREEGHSIATENSILTEFLRQIVAVNGKWEGTPTELLKALNDIADEATKKAKSWPKAPNKLRGTLARIAPSLRHRTTDQHGVDVKFPAAVRGARTLVLERLNPLPAKHHADIEVEPGI
jgi:hypothetical protein